MRCTLILIAIWALGLAGCQEGPEWALETGRSEATTPSEPEGAAGAAVGQTFEPDDASLVIGDSWQDGFEVTVSAARWTDGGAAQIDLTVTDVQTGLPARLSEQHFSFSEDGQALGSEALFQLDRARGLEVVLVLDLSQSIQEAGAVEAVREGARALYDALPRQSRVAVVGFSTDVTVLARFDTAGDDLELLLDTLAPVEGRGGQFTNLWQAVEAAAGLFDEGPGAGGRAVVVFTDGRDNVAEASGEQAQQALEAAGATGWAIGLGADVDGEALTKVVGAGRYTGTRELDQLSTLFEQVASHLTERITLTYTTPKRSGAHRLEVEIADGDRSGGFELRFDLDAE